MVFRPSLLPVRSFQSTCTMRSKAVSRIQLRWTVQGRAKDREQGLLDEIPAGGNKMYRYRIEAVTDRAALDALRSVNR